MVINTVLDDETPICIRRVRADDEQRLKDGIAKLSTHSRYLRFFSGMKTPPQHVIDRLVDVDGHEHIAWGALRIDLADPVALGIVHAFRDEADDDNAQYSVAVIDEYHGLGLARLLTAVLLLDCHREGLRELTVHVLAENKPALALARSLGAVHRGYVQNVSEFEVGIEQAIDLLKSEKETLGLGAIFDQFDTADDQ